MKQKMLALVEQLNVATKAYDEGHPIMSDETWDSLYFELVTLERESDFKLPNSPTQRIIYRVVNKLNKVSHNHKMLSLEKTKELSTVKSFLGESAFLAMCKMDGLTCSLYYKDGFLVSAETRGDGLVGEDILHNAKIIPTIPNIISYLGELVIDGEIVCPYNKFEQFSNEYKNPRNFAAGSIRLLDSKECSTRCLKFVAWDVVKGLDEHITHWHRDPVSGDMKIDEKVWYTDGENKYLSQKFMDLAKLGFSIVPYYDNKHFNDGKELTLSEVIEDIKAKAETFSYPIDGVVFKFNDISFGKSLGETAHHFKNAIAYKFYDEVYPTIIKDVEWTMGRTGVLTPVAILDPVEIDGTVVTRASLHNYGIMYNELGLKYKGQKVTVYKANMIIPQIAEVFHNENNNSEELLPPTVCPICGGEVKIENNNGIQTLVCTNPECSGKLINKLDHFAGKKGLDIKGISKATLEKLINWGWVSNITDIFNLKTYAKEWARKIGFGEKSVNKILTAIEESKNCTLDKFISAIGIPFIGHTVAKDLVKYVSDYPDFRDRIYEGWNFASIPNFGEAKMNAILNFNYTDADIVYKYLNVSNIVEENSSVSQVLENKIFVITGKLKQFKNRNELVAAIEAHGGKVSGSVSLKTSYLVNNDATSASAKNAAAKKLNIPIITEDELISMF